jgi:hypothetical protein
MPRAETVSAEPVSADDWEIIVSALGFSCAAILVTVKPLTGSPFGTYRNYLALAGKSSIGGATDCSVGTRSYLGST